VVHQRLVDRKLASICLELHSRKSSKVQVLEQIKQARNAAAPPDWPDAAFGALQEAQQALRTHADRLHHSSDNSLSAFDLMGRMSLLKARQVPAPNFRLPSAENWEPKQVEQVRLRASQLGHRVAFSGPPCSHPWRGIGIPTPDILQQERLQPAVSATRNAATSLEAAVKRCSDFLHVQDRHAFRTSGPRRGRTAPKHPS
jgi:hypothetical protein